MTSPSSETFLATLRRLAALQPGGITAATLHSELPGSPATVKRQLERLIRSGELIRSGKARATRYSLPGQSPYSVQARHPAAISEVRQSRGVYVVGKTGVAPPWSERSRELLAYLDQSLASRAPVTYQRQFVDGYVPNTSSLLPHDLAEALAAEGGMRGQQPAGTYVRKVLEQLLIDLSWSSSRLEGNHYSLLETQQLFASGAQDGDTDAVMLLNHKRAIEFMVDAVPSYGLEAPVVRNVHSLLMQDLLPDADSLGAIRTKVVNITGTVYLPTQVPSLLEDMFATVLAHARLIKNPVEASFFLWVNLAYLQPFEDGNKRCSRLAANIPLMLYNCAPLSFLDVDQRDYANAMLGVYERLDVSAAVDLFVWTYRRSIRKYSVILEAMGQPDPFRIKHRERLNDAVQAVVREGQTAASAVGALGVAQQELPRFAQMLEDELSKLTVNNCARYRLAMAAVDRWIASGRPR